MAIRIGSRVKTGYMMGKKTKRPMVHTLSDAELNRYLNGRKRDARKAQDEIDRRAAKESTRQLVEDDMNALASASCQT